MTERSPRLRLRVVAVAGRCSPRSPAREHCGCIGESGRPAPSGRGPLVPPRASAGIGAEHGRSSSFRTILGSRLVTARPSSSPAKPSSSAVPPTSRRVSRGGLARRTVRSSGTPPAAHHRWGDTGENPRPGRSRRDPDAARARHGERRRHPGCLADRGGVVLPGGEARNRALLRGGDCHPDRGAPSRHWFLIQDGDPSPVSVRAPPPDRSCFGDARCPFPMP